jgi:chemotaxis signal transduction protein
MAEATACIIPLDANLYIAMGEHEMVHFVEHPVCEAIPHTPEHCQQVLWWEGEILPVMDLAGWLTGQAVERAQAAVGIVRWQERPEAAPQYGALLCTGIPQKVRVRDEQVCDLPVQPSGWKKVAISCFRHNSHPVPIVELSYIFSDALAKHRRCRPDGTA